LASHVKKEKLSFDFPGKFFYFLFLALLGLSVIIVYLRWSNLELPALAFLHDTPVTPNLERFSFACIFPAITLGLFALTPWIAFLLRHWHLEEAEMLTSLKAGFFLSFVLSLVQKWISPDLMAQGWWGERMRQYNGGFSDFNAFGFFAGALFLWQALTLIKSFTPSGDREKKIGDRSGFLHRFGGRHLTTDFLFLFVALTAISLSGSRTAFIFVLAALMKFLSCQFHRWIKATAIALLALMLVFGLGILGKRIRTSLAQVTDLSSRSNIFLEINAISNGRLAMLRDGGLMVARFPLNGVGAGNFLFYLKYLHFGEKTYYDLPLNQYLLIFSELGLFGGLAFILFLATLLKRPQAGAGRFMLGTMALALFFNNFFWFPEALLLFWIIVSLGKLEPGRPRKIVKAGTAVAVLLFVAMNIHNFQDLHPRIWAREKTTYYNYGFSYPEREGERAFRWSGGQAGVYVYLDKNNPKTEYKLACGAPLSRLPKKQQIVDVYWRGKTLKQVVFKENVEVSLLVEDKAHAEGFLEFRVQPTFNLKKMGLGNESRDLGVKVAARYVMQDSESSGVNFVVDRSEKRQEGKSAFHYLSGWIYVNDHETKEQEVYVQLEKPDGTIVYYLSKPMDRFDVGTYFDNEQYNSSGFYVSIPLTDGLDVESCTIRFIVKNKDGSFLSPIWKISNR
jgi:hypothetical protein